MFRSIWPHTKDNFSFLPITSLLTRRPPIAISLTTFSGHLAKESKLFFISARKVKTFDQNIQKIFHSLSWDTVRWEFEAAPARSDVKRVFRGKFFISDVTLNWSLMTWTIFFHLDRTWEHFIIWKLWHSFHTPPKLLLFRNFSFHSFFFDLLLSVACEAPNRSVTHFRVYFYLSPVDFVLSLL